MNFFSFDFVAYYQSNYFCENLQLSHVDVLPVKYSMLFNI